MADGGGQIADKLREPRSRRIDWEDFVPRTTHDPNMTETANWFRIAGRAFLSAAMTLTLATCATNPVTGRRELALISEGQEIQMGQEARDQVIASIGLVPDSGLQRYVSGLGLAMARASERPNLPWSISVVDDPMVNAFALPGGPVFITRGILSHMNSEAQDRKS